MLPFRRGAAWQTLFLLCALAYCINEASSEGRVVCYYTNWSVYRPGTAKFNPQNINPYLCTHLVYAFGGFTKDNQMKPFDKYQDIEQGGYAKFTGLKTYNKQLKTMIAIGGWNEASSRFSPLVASNERRQQFIKNILKFLRQNHFDGIDLDWEYPAHREGGKSRDRDNYAQFVQELRAEFEREAEKTGRTRLLLTMAVPAGIEYIDKGYDVPKLNKYLDWFNVLTYDFHSSHEPSVNHHAPLYSLEEDSEYNYDAELNIDYSIKYYLKAGADRDKLVLGIPTYGRSYTLINEESTELGAPSEGPGEQGDATREKGYLAYYEICQTLKDDPEWTVVQPNANIMGPYAYRRNQWVGYDDEAIVRKKAEYVVAQGLGGIMFWAIDNDDFRGTCTGKPYPLIEAAKEAMVEALGLGINEVAKPSGPQKPSRSRSRDNVNTRNRLNGKTEGPPSTRRPSATRRPAVSSTQAPPPSTTFKLTEAEGSSLYIGGRASTTPPPPTTPDPGSDFKCEEEGFFQHPRDCKKYYWCLDSGPSGLGIVAHMFTCPSGLYFNPAADSCDFARNVPCKTKKSTTAAPVTSTTPTTTTVRSNRVTAAPTARPVYPRITTTTSTTTTTTTTPATVDEDLEYEEDTDELSPSKSTDAEEDPQVIKELIDLIRKVGGVEQLEKHLLRNKDGSITLKENSATGAATTPSTISKSLYDRVLSRPGTLSSFSRNRFKISDATETTTAAAASSSSSRGQSTLTSNSNSKYSSVLRGNSRQGPQNEGIEKLAEFDGFLKERKQYVTINRHRSANQEDEEEHADQQEEEENLAEVQTTTRRPLSSITPSYTSLRRSRPTTVAPPAEESHVEAEQHTQTQVKSYATLSRTRGRTTASPEVTEAAPSSTTNRYKYFERTRPTKSATAEDSEDPTEDEEEEYEDEQKDIVTDQTISSTTQATPPATTLLHVFTLLEGEGQEEEPTTRRPTVRLYPTIQTEVVPKHKVVEINRIVEINSKQAKAAQRKSKANNDFGILMVESLPHVEQLGEISVVKYVHLVDGSDIQINDGHSTVADYTPTEPTSAAQSPASLPVRNSLPETEGGDTDRSGKSLVPEVLTAALETSTISLEGLFDSARKGKQLSSNTIIGETEESTTIGSSSSSATETGETTTPAPTYLRQPTTGSVSRRPVLSVRRRIINSPTSAAIETTTQQPAAEPPTTSKYNRLRSRPSAAAAAAAATTTTAAATTAFPAATSAPGGRTTSNIYLSKLKAKSGAAAAAAAASGEAATLQPATSNISSSSGSNDITQKQHKFQPASFALRRQFQTRRLTTFAPAANGEESATEVPRTQNPLFKRRLTLISTTPPSARTTNPPVSGLETTTTLYLNDDDEDQVAKSSIHTSRFNQIPEQVRPRDEYDLALPPQPLKSTIASTTASTTAGTTASTTVNLPLPVIGQGIRRQLIPRPRRPQSTTSTPPTTSTLGSSLRSTTPAGHSAPPLSRRQQSRRRPHKYIEVYSRPPAKSAVISATSSSQFLDEEFSVGQSQVAQRRRSGSILPTKSDPKVIVHGHGIIECRAQGNFPHPLNCRKFISCARFEETGGIVGWEYTCPKGLTYDGVGGMCTWSPSDQPCRD
ncbi:mucin-5AC isoform X6 [Drosophila erecta]|uniref:mucin-5AC isoform X6 n=1 Tax=Drosophila erecta TaxID=7220 RepID=UPI000F0480C4|nr:mucin-5AC isoform X6 [Drosophila erecta]